MDQNEYAAEGQDVLDVKPEKVLYEAGKPETACATPKKVDLLRNQTLETELMSHTPEKTNQPLKAELEGREFELFQRHKNMVELFDGMTCSLRLLGLRKLPPTFQNIRAQVEVLTKRKFSYGHVAQLKYILPEAIQIEKILVHDKKTLCMKPEMKIMLVFDVVDGHLEESNYIALHQLFISRLIKYFTANPKASEVPAAVLPDPFNQSKEISSETASVDGVNDIPEVIDGEPQSQASHETASENLLSNASLEDLSATIEPERLLKLSHMNPSFRRHFSEKVVSDTEKTTLLASLAPLSSQDIENVNANLDAEHGNEKESVGIILEPSSINPQPTISVSSQSSINAKTCESPLLKRESTIDSTVVETPAQSIPKRVIPSSDDSHKVVTCQKQTSSSKPAKRTLDFSSMEGDESESCEFFPSRSQSRDAALQLLKAENIDESAADGRRMSQSNKTEEQISVDLPGLVSLIHRIFQSVGYSSITKEELVHKIIINNLDFEESGQVEDQIEILEKLVPDWICRELVPSGDNLYSIKKVSDLDSLRSRVACI